MSNCGSPSIIRACAIIGNTVVPYRRVGRGHPVLLMAAAVAAATVPLPEAPRGLCVIAPEGSPHGPAFIEWLAVFLDSLGIQDMSIIGIGNFAGLAREFAALEPDRVRRVLSISDGENPLAVADALRSIASLTAADTPLNH